MPRQLILLILLLKYVLIESQSSMHFTAPFELEFHYAFTKPTLNGSAPVTAHLHPKRDADHYYILIVNDIDENSILVRAVNCFYRPSHRGYCAQPSGDAFISFANYSLFDDHVLRIENNRVSITKILNRSFHESLVGNQFSLTIVSLDRSVRPTDPTNNSSPNTNLIGTIFLSACIGLVFLLGFGWFGVIYYRRYREYRMKKKLRQELAQATQQVLDQSPIIIYDPTKEGMDDESTCAICLELFKPNEKLRQLEVCTHYFHCPCIDPWLLSHQNCPLCNRNILHNSIPTISSTIMAANDEHHHDESTSITRNDNNRN